MYKLKLLHIFLFLFFAISVFPQHSLNAENLDVSTFHKVLQQGEFAGLLDEVHTNKALQFERLASYFFHQRINEYRLENGLTTLYWDERMWLAARNHNVYMSKTKYGHDEKRGAVGFTGVAPSDRIQFVTYNGFKMSLYGENILMNFSADYPSLLVDNAKNIAEDSFEMWRKSPPHNKNMLHPDFFAHGTSFYNGNNKLSQIFGTSNFGNSSDFVEQEISITWSDSLAKLFPPKAESNRKPIKPVNWSVKQAEKELFNVLKSKMPKHTSAYIADFTLAAELGIKNKKESKVTDYKPLSAKQRFLRVAKDSKTKFLLTNLNEKCYSFEFSMEQLTDKSALSAIDQRIAIELPPATKITNWGGKCILSEKGTKFVCEIDLIYVFDN